MREKKQMNDQSTKGKTAATIQREKREDDIRIETREAARREMHQVMGLRTEALDRAVRVSLANGGQESTDDTVKRAEAFEKFLTEATPGTDDVALTDSSGTEVKRITT